MAKTHFKFAILSKSVCHSTFLAIFGSVLLCDTLFQNHKDKFPASRIASQTSPDHKVVSQFSFCGFGRIFLSIETNLHDDRWCQTFFHFCATEVVKRMKRLVRPNLNSPKRNAPKLNCVSVNSKKNHDKNGSRVKLGQVNQNLARIAKRYDSSTTLSWFFAGHPMANRELIHQRQKLKEKSTNISLVSRFVVTADRPAGRRTLFAGCIVRCIGLLFPDLRRVVDAHSAD